MIGFEPTESRGERSITWQTSCGRFLVFFMPELFVEILAIIDPPMCVQNCV